MNKPAYDEVYELVQNLRGVYFTSAKWENRLFCVAGFTRFDVETHQSVIMVKDNRPDAEWQQMATIRPDKDVVDFLRNARPTTPPLRQ